MIRFFRVLILVGVALSLAIPAGPALAQENSTTAANETVTTAFEPDGDGYRIDTTTRVVSESFNEDTGELTIVIESDIPQSITIADKGGFDKEGPVNRRRPYLQTGRHTITLQLTETEDGDYGYSVSTEKVLYSHQVEESRDAIIGGPWGPSDLWIVGGLSVVLGVASVPLMKRLLSKRLRSDRVL